VKASIAMQIAAEDADTEATKLEAQAAKYRAYAMRCRAGQATCHNAAGGTYVRVVEDGRDMVRRVEKGAL
jgi:hypothetical protein